jgi:ATP-dependent DNA helicase 2 subunit 1
MLKKNRVAIIVGLVRSNSQPTFYAAIPQAEVFENDKWTEPAGLHLIPLPFADDIRDAPIQQGFKGSCFRVTLRPVLLNASQRLKIRTL